MDPCLRRKFPDTIFRRSLVQKITDHKTNLISIPEEPEVREGPVDAAVLDEEPEGLPEEVHLGLRQLAHRIARAGIPGQVAEQAVAEPLLRDSADLLLDGLQRVAPIVGKVSIRPGTTS